MKDQFGNDNNMNRDSINNRNVDKDKIYNKGETTEDNRNVESDRGYNDRQEGLRDTERNDDDKFLGGIFEKENEAINVINRLKEIGYDEDDITVVAKDDDLMDRIDDETDVDTKSEGDDHKIATGAAIGGTFGGIATALPALGLLAIPGVGPILAAGPIAGILGGVITGGIAGGIVGGLVKLGVREEKAEEYKRQIEQGKIIVLVENRDDMRDDVHETYRQNNSVMDGRTRQR